MFEAVVSQEGKVPTIALNGECDLQIFPDIDELLMSSCGDGFSSVRIDLRGLTFIDSSGLRALMMAKARADSHGTNLSIVPAPAAVMRVFELVGLLDQLPFENLSAAS
jgi:anti-sigma B factor antagonist